MAKVCLRGVVMGALLAMTASAYADNVGKSNGDSLCITSSATAEMQDCGGLTRGQVKRPSAPVSKLDTIDRKKDDKKSGPTGPSIELDAAARRNREAIKAREFSLLTREVALLRRLSDRTPVKDPRRPDILLRLAETLFEMQAVVNERVRKYDEPIYQCQKKKDQGCVKKLSGEQKKAEAELKTIREDTIRAYATLVKDHPSFKRMDEVLFSLAFGLEELRQFDRARQVYHRLIKGFPQSKFVPHAYLSFAEYYFAEGDMKAALQFYGKVLEFPPARNPVYGYSLYKSAWAAYNMEDFKGSLKMFTDVIEFATQNPDARDSENLAKQSRKEMVLPYAMVGTPNKALEFFSRFTKTKQQALETFEALGELYFDTGKWENVIAVYQRLIAEAPRSERVCYWQTRVANAIISSKPKVDQVREAQRVVDLYDTFSKDNRPQEAVNECKQAAVTMLVSLATSWHREAIGAEGQPGTNDRNTMKYASTLYRLALDKFKDLDKLEFPDIDRRDWPTEYKLQYFYAELLWKMEEWGQCGPAFDHVVELNPKGEYTSDAAYAAVLCYNNLYQQQYQATERQVRRDESRRGKKGKKAEPEAESYEPRQFTTLEKGMLNAFQRYLCVVGESSELPTIKYRRARIYYEANHFEEAAVLFKDIAWNHRDSDLAEFAANLYLDSLNVLGTQTKTPKVACISEIETAIEPLSGFYCSSESAKDDHEDLCGVLGQLRCDVMRKKAEAYHATKQFTDAGKTYVRIFRKFPECGSLDEVLYNAALEFEAARLLGRAIQVRGVLIDKYPESQLSKKALYLIGANYHALAYYQKASEYYEKFATKFPGEDGAKCSDAEKKAGTCAIATDALENAVFFRLGLNDEENALDDAKLFEKNYGKRKPQKASQVFYAIGNLYERKKDWKAVIQHYEKYLKSYKRSGLPQQVIQASVKIGVAYWNMNDTKRASGPFNDAVKAGKGVDERISKIGDVDDATREKWLFEAKDAISEAIFYLSEYKYRDFKEIKFPEYKGGKSAKSVTDWSEKSFKPWVEKKQKALVVAQTSYEEIAPLKIPRWEIAAASRIGEMWRSFVDEFRDAPIPKEIEKDPELFDIYVGRLDEVSEPFVKQAIDKFEFCLIRSTQVRWFDEHSQQCEVELNRLSPRDYPLAAEIRAQPNFTRSTYAEPAKVELRSGEGDDNEVPGDQS